MRIGAGSGLRAVLICALLGACGGGGEGDDVFADARPSPDARPDGGGDGDGDGGGIDAAAPLDGPIDLSGPIITVVSPTTPADLSSGEIETTDRLTVTCRVEGNPNTGDGVDPGSVGIAVFGEAGLLREAVAQPTTEADTYEAVLSLAGFFNGYLKVRCTASDQASPARTTSADVDTYLDLGPRIAVFSPLDNAAYAGAVTINFRVSAAPITADDPGAAPDLTSVTATVGGVDITGDLVRTDDVFSYTVQFEDERFTPPLDGPQALIVTAANSRSTVPVRRQRSVPFLADSAGPTIAIEEPAAGLLVAGFLQVSAVITDPAGVDATSVVATLPDGIDADQLVEQFPLTFVGSDTYEGYFDTRQLPDTMVYPNLIIRARDSVNNQRSVGRVITLDNRAPIVDLDPPDMREMYFDSSIPGNQCSWKFDPLGGHPIYGDAAAADDGESLPQLVQLRARIEDRGNGASASQGVLVPMAGVDPASAQLYVLADENNALVVDTDGDNVCDDINPNIVPSIVPVASNEAAVVDLIGVAPAGKPVMLPGDPDPFQGSAEALCMQGDDSDVNEPLCIEEPGSRITSMPDGTPVIYGVAPVTADQCWGNAFDSQASGIADGWTCAAVVAVDNVGNVSVSPPLRVCFDHDQDPNDPSTWNCAPWGTITTTGLPNCTGTYNPLTGVTNAADPCTPRRFADPEFADRQVRCIGTCPPIAPP